MRDEGIRMPQGTTTTAQWEKKKNSSKILISLAAAMEIVPQGDSGW